MYDPLRSYDDNYENGPFLDLVPFAKQGQHTTQLLGPTRYSFLGVPLSLPLGVAAGPLLNAQFMNLAFGMGFSSCTYKTVRSSKHESHPLPNIVQTTQCWGPHTLKCELLSSVRLSDPCLSISNSFGVPSQNPDIWSRDLGQLRYNSSSQMAILSFQGTRKSTEDQWLQDWQSTAQLAAINASNKRIHALEINLSCPNEGGLPTFLDINKSTQIIRIVRSKMRDISKDLKLIVKIGLLPYQATEDLLKRNWFDVDAWSAINTVPHALVDANHWPILGSHRVTAGVCGARIFEAALDYVRTLCKARHSIAEEKWAKGSHWPQVIAVGGAHSAARVLQFLNAGANHVQVATSAMWHGPHLVRDVARTLGVPWKE